jgi:HAD superfamily hydrolase (TIGR01509 family)
LRRLVDPRLTHDAQSRPRRAGSGSLQQREDDDSPELRQARGVRCLEVINALLFDFDGVIVDTEVPTFESWRETYAQYGVDLALDDWLPAVGSGSSVSGAFDAVVHLERLIGRTVDREAVIAYRTRRKTELYARAPLLPGVAERLAEARERGSSTAIVTRNHEDRVRAHCELVGLEHEFHALVCANEEPTRDKTELYRRALTHLDVHANEALAFEDSPAGVSSAKRAGVLCAAVPNDITRGAAFGEADVVLASLAEYPLDEIVHMVSVRRP